MSMNIGFIGLGNMGGAVAKAVSQVDDTNLLLSNYNPTKAHALQQQIGGQLLSNKEIMTQAQVVFLGVKPHQLSSLLADLKGQATPADQTIISMAAGVNLADLTEMLPNKPIIRMMPNTPVEIGQGMTTYTTLDGQASPLFEDLMVYAGQVTFTPENLMDAATAIAGCGPAFVYQFIEALADAGVQNGLSRQVALDLAAQTVAGSAQMVSQTKKHPAQLRDEVTSPGGSTIAGVVALEKHGFRYAIISAINKALKKTKKLGKN